MSNALHLAGLIPPVITPLTPGGTLDEPAIARQVEYLIEGGVNGLFVLGTSGEGPWLTPEQARAVVAHAVRAAAGRVPVLAGALEPSTRRTIAAVSAAADAGADAVVVTTPYYFAADDDMQRRHFEAVSAASPIPVVLYNIPPMTHNPLRPQTVGRLIADTRIVAIKDSAGDWTDFLALLGLRDQRPGFRVFQGAERLSARALRAGADGLVPGLGNYAPEVFAEMIRAARAGDAQAADAAERAVEALWPLHTHGFWLACLKYAVSLNGQCGDTTSGAEPLPETAKAAIRATVSAVRSPTPVPSRPEPGRSA